MADDARSPARSQHGDEDPGAATTGDVIDFGELPAAAGSPVGTTRSRRPWVRWLPIAIAASVVAAIVVHAATGERSPSTVANPTPTPAVATPYPAGGSPPGGHRSDPVYYEMPQPILGITSAWELFGFGVGRDGSDPEVVRIQFGDGGITRTPLPPLDSTGPVTFAAGLGWAVVRPLDDVPGYLVRSRQRAQALPAALRSASVVLPGPDNRVWAALDDSRNGHVHMILADGNGRPAGPRIELPATLSGNPQPDQSGNVVVAGADGVYQASPAGLRRITTGALVAAGPTRWLTLECDGSYRCALTVIDRSANARRTLRTTSADEFASQINPLAPSGVISPNGTYAVVTEDEGLGDQAYHLINLVTGDDKQLHVPFGGAASAATTVFSPDSRWLFAAGADGAVDAVDTATGNARSIGVNLPPIDLLAVVDAMG